MLYKVRIVTGEGLLYADLFFSDKPVRGEEESECEACRLCVNMEGEGYGKFRPMCR